MTELAIESHDTAEEVDVSSIRRLPARHEPKPPEPKRLSTESFSVGNRITGFECRLSQYSDGHVGLEVDTIGGERWHHGTPDEIIEGLEEEAANIKLVIQRIRGSIA